MQFGEVEIAGSSLVLSNIAKRESWAWCALANASFLDCIGLLVVLRWVGQITCYSVCLICLRLITKSRILCSGDSTRSPLIKVSILSLCKRTKLMLEEFFPYFARLCSNRIGQIYSRKISWYQWCKGKMKIVKKANEWDK